MINKVKIQGNGYLVNGNMSVPKAEGNRHYREILEAIKGGTEDYPIAIVVEDEFTQDELDLQVQATFRATRNTLLSKLDIEINIAVDAGLVVDELRKYRQALRDATQNWVMPEPIG